MVSILLSIRVRAWRIAARLYRWASRRLYNEFAPFYDLAAWLVSGGRWAAWRRMTLDYLAGQRVLEVGPGTGDLLIEMARRGLEVCGLEPSPAMQRVATRKQRRQRLRVPCVRGRAQALPFGDSGFDHVVSTFPAEFIADPAALREMGRVLRPSGRAGRLRPGTLVVVGLAVYRARPRLPGRFWLRPAPDPLVEHFRQAAEQAGLAVRAISRFDGSARVPVLLAERRP